MSFSNNIKFLRKRKGSTQDEVAIALNMKRSTLSGYENEIAQPSLDVLKAFSGYYGVSIDALVKSDITQLSEFYILQLEKGNDAYITGSELRVLATTVDKENEENIELIPIKAKAGYKTGFADPEYIKTLVTFQMPFLSKDKKYRTFQISGDSMLPIPDGSWVTGEYVQNWNLIRDKHAYIVLTLDEGIVFKVAENKISSGGFLRLHSFNPVYEPFDVKVSEIREIWKFVNYISSELPEPNTYNENLISKINVLQNDVEQMKKHIGIGSGRLFE
jgi:transcriptional regulator with XRE-family HTH domain